MTSGRRITPIDWVQVAAAGYKFAYVKATEGNYYQNPYLPTDYDGIAGAAMYRGAYHFAIPSASSGGSQADYLLDAGGSATDGRTLPPMVDLEWDPYHPGACYGLSQSQMVSWISAFSGEVQRRTGRPPVIYTAAAWWLQCTGGSSAFSASPLSIAHYGSSPPVTPGWSTWAFWQYTSTGSVPGISGYVDADYFNGSTGTLGSIGAL